tara:strand:- start:23987 stop:24889 length:903 start_codon:yes stop_codon:yes gene_type:complete
MKTLLMTGHMGLVGRYLKPLLESHGFNIKGFDLLDQSGDITNVLQVEQALDGCDGIIHLAAVSRVIWAEQNPEKCWNTNAVASEKLLKAAVSNQRLPWVLVASSREVYGEPKIIPVSEDQLLAPVNIYGKAKAYMEKQTLLARGAGINTAIVRLANVYGCTEDHTDRVLPAFCRRAVEGNPLRVDGFGHLFDFTHVSDTVIGIARMVALLDCGERELPPIHLLPGIGTTLKEAAQLAVKSAGAEAEIFEADSRSYDVCRFIGSPERALQLLGWQASIQPKDGIAMLVNRFKEKMELEALA